MCWQLTNRPALLILVYWIYIYISSTNGTLSDRPMNDNLWMLHCVVYLARIQAGDSLWYCSEQTYITLHDHACHDLSITTWHGWLFPSKLLFVFFCFIFRFSDFSVAFVSRRGGSLCWISKISNQLIYFLSLGLFSLQSNIAYVVLLSIFRLRDGYMGWRQ